MEIPKPGEKYKHFKHDPSKGDNHHMYEIVSISRHTETEDVLVIYKPLYELDFIKEKGCDSCARPLEMFIEEVDKPEYKGPRFIKVQ